MKTGIENLYNLFQLAHDFMVASSGDGGSLIVCDKGYSKFADAFEAWSMYLGKFRKDYPEKNTTVFERNQEGIVFADRLKETDYNMYELILILPSWYIEFIEQEKTSTT